MKLRKLAAIAALLAGVAGCSPQGMANLNGALLGAAMGGPVGALAGYDMVQPGSEDHATSFVVINSAPQPIPQDNQDNSDGWMNVQSGDNTVLIPDSMRGVYQQ